MRDVETVEWAIRLMADVVTLAGSSGACVDLKQLSATVNALPDAAGRPGDAAWQRIYAAVDAAVSWAAHASTPDRTGAAFRLTQFLDDNADLSAPFRSRTATGRK